jgi:hypothetical protein
LIFSIFFVIIKKKEKGVFQMRSTGITRKMDSLGRLVIPSGLRGELNLKENE